MPSVTDEVTTRARLSRTLRAVARGVPAVAAIAVVAAGVAVATGDHAAGRSLRARLGDCFAGAGGTDLKRVQCDDRTARWTVLGVVEQVSETDARQQACAAWTGSEASYWESRNGVDGFVLCLRSVPAA